MKVQYRHLGNLLFDSPSTDQSITVFFVISAPGAFEIDNSIAILNLQLAPPFHLCLNKVLQHLHFFDNFITIQSKKSL